MGAIRRLLSAWADAPPPVSQIEATTRTRDVADTFQEICRDCGPWEAAAAIHSPSDDLRTIAYLFASNVTLSEDRDLCVEAGIRGFEEWAADRG